MGIIPTVLFVIAASIAETLIKLSSPMSTGTGVPPATFIADAVASIVCDEIITSSPLESVSPKENATKLMKLYKIDGVPQLIVNGTFSTSPGMVGGSHKRALRVVDYLLDKK